MKLNTKSLKELGDMTVQLLKKYTPEIATGVGIAGMVTTTIVAVRATPKAIDLIDDEKRKVKDEYRDANEEIPEKIQLKPFDYVRVTWKLYLPAVVTGAASIACIIGANRVQAGRNATLAAACAVSEARFSDYRDKVIEVLGKKKDQTVRDELAKDRINANPLDSTKVIDTGAGKTLCYDPLSGRYFYSDIDEIKRSINELNHQLLYDETVKLNDLYEYLGLDPNKLGEDLGWDVNRGLVEPTFSSQLAEGTPCIVIDYIAGPFYTGYSFTTPLDW